MQVLHRDMAYLIPDEWWEEAGMALFTPARRTYRPGPADWPNLPVFEVAVDDVEPLRRNLSHGVFNDSPESGTAHSRVVRILRGFREDCAIPPVEVSRRLPDGAPKFKLVHGAHRFYCAVAAGYSHVPAVEVTDVWGDTTSEA